MLYALASTLRIIRLRFTLEARLVSLQRVLQLQQPAIISLGLATILAVSRLSLPLLVTLWAFVAPAKIIM
jgi:hypothetical protein